MKTLIMTLTAACAVVAGYFGARYFTRQDLGFTLARKFVRNFAENLLHAEFTTAGEAATPGSGTDGQA